MEKAEYPGMSKDRLRQALYGLTGAREGELGLVLKLFLYNLLLITSYLIVKPVRNSLFLDHLGAENLPWAYIGTAVFVGAAVWAYFRLVDRFERTTVVVTTWCALAAGLVSFWFLLGLDPLVGSALFYFFSAVYSVTGVTQFWTFCAEVLDSRQAKRVYGFVGAGGILGGLVGGVLTRSLVHVIGTEQLLFVSAAFCLVCAALGGSLCATTPTLCDRLDASAPAPEAKAPAEDEPAVGWAEGLRALAADRYMLMVGAVILSMQLVTTLVDYGFSHVVADAFASKDAKTAFFGTFFICLNTSSLAFQLLFTSRIQGSLGVSAALSFLPGVTLATSLSFFLWPVFLAGCVMKLTCGALDYSIDRASRELLWLPVAPATKRKAKAFVDMFLFRLFRCLAGVLILLFTASGLGVHLLGLAIAGVCLAWISIAFGGRPEYVRQVRARLAEALGQPLHEVSAAAAVDPSDPTLGELRWELERLLSALAEVGAHDGDWEGVAHHRLRHSRGRILDLFARLYGAEDIALARQALDDPARRPLAIELLDGVADARYGRVLVRVLDPERELADRLAQGRALARRLGRPVPRPRARLVWPASMARATT